MRILGLKVRNWRGLETREVAFEPTGVTVIVGPNEAGKTSLFEALDMLLDRLDSSTKADLKAVKPVHRDEGAEVEAEIETGPYRFLYRKRFHKRPLTELNIEAPRPENLTGREAHQRVQEILEETLDLSLWKALRTPQSARLEVAALDQSNWLKNALDRAAGSEGASDPAGESLFEAVLEERARWWTDTGRPRRELIEVQEREAARRAAVEALEARLAALEKDLEAEERLAREIVRTAAECGKVEQRAADHEQALAEIARCRTLHEQARTERALAERALEAAQATLARRERLERQLEDAAREAAAAAEDLARTAPALEAARGATQEAEAELSVAQSAFQEARALRERAEKDHDLLRTELDLVLMRERRARIEKCDQERAEAEEFLERVRVTPEALVRLHRLRDQQIRAEARLDAASTEVELRALQACEPVVDGRPEPLAAGESRGLRAVEPLSIELPGVLSIQIRSGEGVRASLGELEADSRALAEALESLGVATLEQAIALNNRRDDALELLERCLERRTEELRDLSLEELLNKIERARAYLEDARAKRPSEPPLPTSLEAAKRTRSELDKALVEREAALARARAVLEERRGHAQRLFAEQADVQGRFRALEAGRAALLQEAAVENRAATRAALRAAFEQATKLAQAAQAGETEAARALAALRPEDVEELARADAARAIELARRRHALELEWTGLTARLASRAEEGLAEKLGQARAAHRVAAGEAASRLAQAEAARLLHAVMEEERAAERARYVAPFREKVGRLGRTVFGPDFSVAIGADLRIESRTLEGVSVPFEDLSAGTREQLGVVTRLACALLAAEEGGVPVVLDDAFGWSDPDRLERIGALLGVAGRTCQIILLTCDPARGQGIPGAKWVRLTCVSPGER